MSRTVVQVARRYQRNSQQIPLEDLCQEASAHLVRQAVPKFDPEEALWNTYAGWWIRASAHRTFVRDRTVHIPEGAFLLGARANPISIETPTGNDDGTILDELVADSPEPDDDIEIRTRRAMVDAVLRPPLFDAKDVYVYCRRYRLGDSNDTVGTALGFSREHIRQIVERLEGDLAKALLARRSPVRIDRRCPGWPARCGNCQVNEAGYCRRCWFRLEQAAGGELQAAKVVVRKPRAARPPPPRRYEFDATGQGRLFAERAIAMPDPMAEVATMRRPRARTTARRWEQLGLGLAQELARAAK